MRKAAHDFPRLQRFPAAGSRRRERLRAIRVTGPGRRGIDRSRLGQSVLDDLTGQGLSPSQAQNASWGAQIGSIIGQVVPIPGLAQIGSFVGGLFGPSVHTTPGGETFDAATYELHSGYFQMMQLVNEIRAQMGLQPAPLIGFVGLGTPGCAAKPDDGTTCAQCSSLNCGAVNAPLTGPYLAKLLGNPSYASMTAESQTTQLQQQGVFDAGIQMQQEIISHLEFTLQSLQAGTLVVAGGAIVPAGTVPDYQTVTNQGASNAAGSYDDLQQQSTGSPVPVPNASTTALAWLENPYIVGGAVGALAFVLLVKKLRR